MNMSKPDDMTDTAWENRFSKEVIYRQQIAMAALDDAVANKHGLDGYLGAVDNWIKNTLDNGATDTLPIPPARVERTVHPISLIVTVHNREPLLDQWIPPNEMRKKMKSEHLALLGLKIEAEVVYLVKDISYYDSDINRWQAGRRDTMPDGAVVTHGGKQLVKRRKWGGLGWMVYYEEVK